MNQDVQFYNNSAGAYLDFFKTSSSINRGFTMTGKSTEKMEERKPGPACYSPQQSKISDGPKFTMNGKDYTYEKEKSPGPARVINCFNLVHTKKNSLLSSSFHRKS